MKAGTTVIWVNHDDIPHSIVCPTLQLKSHPLDTDDTFSYKFEQPGTYDYICGLHPICMDRSWFPKPGRNCWR